MKHTPGPWAHPNHETVDPNGGPYVMVSNAEGLPVAMVLRSVEDADLIASAPELLSALERLVKAVSTASATDEWANDEYDAFQSARSLISRLRSEEE